VPYPFINVTRIEIHAPFSRNEVWNDPKASSAVGPKNHVSGFRWFRTEATGVWRNSDSSKNETVSIPARLNRYVGMGPLVGMAATRAAEQFVIVVRQVKQTSLLGEEKGEEKGTFYFLA
jgi:hypothetical protein